MKGASAASLLDAWIGCPFISKRCSSAKVSFCTNFTTALVANKLSSMESGPKTRSLDNLELFMNLETNGFLHVKLHQILPVKHLKLYPSIHICSMIFASNDVIWKLPLYFWAFERKCLDSCVSPLSKVYNGSGGGGSIGNFTFPLKQHNPGVSLVNFNELQ